MSKRGFSAMALAMALLMSGSVTAEVPSSARSREVVKRVEPRLKGELQKLGLMMGAPVFIRIFKEPAKLELWMEKGAAYRLFRTYEICKFSGSLGPKLKEGDGQAPEGCYTVSARQMNPNSSYHLSFNLGFPNEYDRHHGRTGSALMVHGACVSIGCYAMGDEAIEEIWTLCVRALEKGQRSFPVHCFPFPLTAANLKQHEGNAWIEFWRELEPVYSMFEKTRIPPRVIVRQGKYEVKAGLRVERAGFGRPVRDLKCFVLEPGTEVTGLLSDVPSGQRKGERGEDGPCGTGAAATAGGRRCNISFNHPCKPHGKPAQFLIREWEVVGS